MKQKLVIVSSIVSLVLSAVMLALASATMAWLAMNQEATSKGMQLAIEASPSLLITSDPAEFSDVATMNGGNPYEVNFPANSSATYKPSTYVGSYATYPAGLCYVSNTVDVDPVTGYAKSSATLNLNGVVPSSAVSNPYFVDYVVYVAANSQQITGAVLKAEITSAKKSGVEVESGTLMATSIDVYRGTEISSATYCGTLNVSTKDSHQVELFDDGLGGHEGTVPEAPASYLTYTFRCYFDGDLTSGSSGIAYINTATLDTSRVTLNVRIFIAEEE